jgi:hypothetical protein
MPYYAGSIFDSFTTAHGNESWTFDSLDEWYAAYDRSPKSGGLQVSRGEYSLTADFNSWSATVSITAPSNERVARLMRYFNVAEAESKLPVPAVPEPPALPVVVFIGHGRSADWRDIKDHLRDSQVTSR